MSESRTSMRYVRLQSVGWVAALEVSELKPGDTLLWNFGYRSEVVRVEPVGNGGALLVTRTDDGQEYTRRKRMSTLVACGRARTAERALEPAVRQFERRVWDMMQLRIGRGVGIDRATAEEMLSHA